MEEGEAKRARSAMLTRGSLFGNTSRLLYYCSSMTTKTKQQSRRSKARMLPTALKEVAHAALPSRFGRFTIHGFAGKGPMEEAVALVRGHLRGKTPPHSLAVPNRRCAGFPALRLPRTTRALPENNCQGAERNFALSTAGRPGDRIDEQIARLPIAGWGHGHGGGQ